MFSVLMDPRLATYSSSDTLVAIPVDGDRGKCLLRVSVSREGGEKFHYEIPL